VLGEQDRPALQNMSQHEANRIMANPVPFIFPSRPSSQTYDGMDLANGRNNDTRDGQTDVDPNRIIQNGHAHQVNGGWKGNRASYGLSAAEEKRRLQKSMGRNMNANSSPPQYTQNATLPLSGQVNDELNPLRRESSLGNDSLSATLGSQSRLHLPSDEDARYEHFEHLSSSSPNISSPPNAPISTSPPNSPTSPTSPYSVRRQSGFVDPSPIAIHSQDVSSDIADTSPTMMRGANVNTNTSRSRPTSARRFTVTNPSHNMEM
jgi:hypothetical protein